MNIVVCIVLFVWYIVVLVNVDVCVIFLRFMVFREKYYRGFNKVSNKVYINNVCRVIYVYL